MRSASAANSGGSALIATSRFEPRVACAEDPAHAALADERDDLVGAELRSDVDRHRWADYGSGWTTAGGTSDSPQAFGNREQPIDVAIGVEERRRHSNLGSRAGVQRLAEIAAARIQA